MFFLNNYNIIIIIFFLKLQAYYTLQIVLTETCSAVQIRSALIWHQFAMDSQIVQISQMKPKVCVLHFLKRTEIELISFK